MTSARAEVLPSRGLPSRILARGGLLLLVLVLAYPVGPAHVARAQEAESRPSQPAEKETINVKIPSDEAELTDWILERYQKLPVEYNAQRGREQRRQTMLYVDSLIVGGRIHIKRFQENPQRGAVLAIVAHCLAVNYRRHLSEKRKEYKEITGERMPVEEQQAELHTYLDEIFNIARAGLSHTPPPEFHALLELSVGDAHDAKREYAEAAAAYARAVAAQPDGPRARRATSSLGMAHYNSGDYAGSRKAMGDYVRRWPGTTLWPEHVFSLHRAYRASGFIDEGFALWKLMAPHLLAGAEGRPLPDSDPELIVASEDRIRYAEFHAMHPFFLAFYRMAQGEHRRAAGHYEDFLQLTDAMQPMPQRVDVFRRFQAIPYHTFCTGLAGRPFPMETMEGGWLEPPKEGLKGPALVYISSPVVALRHRHEKITRRLPVIASSMSEPVQLWWIRGGKRYRDADQVTDEQRANDLEDYQIELAEAAETAGFQDAAIGVDRDRKLYESLFMDPGTPHLYVVDGEGNLTWMVIDPMHWDEGLFRAVLQRAIDRGKQ